jgi:outer membrane protein assembly factor BamB
MTRSAPCWTLLALLPALAAGGPARAENWPQWRGPAGDSVSTEAGLPVKWGEKTNLAWQCPLPGQGASTPAVWGDALFVTTQDGEALSLLKITAGTGRVEWSRQVGTGSPRRQRWPGPSGGRRQQKFHKLHNMASPSPVTDGELVVAHFGNGDLAAYDFAGRRLWQRNLQKDQGTYTIWWGHANSPVLYRDLVISVCMQDSLADLGGDRAASYLVAHDKHTGAERWKTLRETRARAEECDAYTTPVLRRDGDRAELVVMGANQIDGYDPATGKQLWFLPGLKGGRTITGPTLAHGLAYATRGMRGELLAVRLGGSGELPPRAVVWRHSDGTPDSPCPVVWQGLLFWVSDNGFAHCCDARTGALKWKERLAGDFKASPLAADGRIYFLNRAGVCTVVAAADKFERLAVNRVEDETIASPAVSGGRIFLRGQKALYCIGVQEPRPATGTSPP